MTTTADLTSTNIKALFPHQTLDPILTTPTYTTICHLNTQLNANATSVPYSNSYFGFIGLTATNRTFTDLTGDSTFTKPVDPGLLQIPTKATSAHTANAQAQHQMRLQNYLTCLATDAALKAQLLNAVPEVYTRALATPTLGYARVTTKQLLTHLYEMYGTISAKDIARNDANIRAPLDTTKPIETFFERIELCQEFATATQDPFSQRKMVNIVHTAFQNIPKFKLAVREWKKKEQEEKTYEMIKHHFMLANDEIKDNENNETAATMQYSASNNVLNTNTTINTLKRKIHELNASINTISNHANNTKHTNGSKRTFSTIYDPKNVVLETQGGGKSIDANPANLEFMGTKNRFHTLRNLEQNTPTKTTAPYCFTHGFAVAKNHTSQTCKKPHNQHVNYATALNRCGGSTYGYVPGNLGTREQVNATSIFPGGFPTKQELNQNQHITSSQANAAHNSLTSHDSTIATYSTHNL